MTPLENTELESESLFAKLNPEQAEAVRHVDGPLLIFAGAGSGKTRVLTNRVAYMIAEKAIPPKQILAVTFTNKAASEMKERIVHLVGEKSKSIWIGTFHSICVRLLREYGTKIGIDRDFLIYDDNDQVTIIRDCLNELNLDDKRYPPRAMLSHISRAKDKLIRPENYLLHFKGFYEEIVAKVYDLYQMKLWRNRCLDFDDLIRYSVMLFEQRKDILEQFQKRIRYVLVDEYQDVNYAQYRLMYLIASKERNLCVVGDDDQSIYMFRGADVSLILKFNEDYPDARTIKLEQNYRSTGRILQAAYSVVSNNTSRADKMLWTDKGDGEHLEKREAENEQEEALWVLSMINQEVSLSGRKYDDFAILFRTNAQSRAFEEVFRNFSLPYKLIGGVGFYDRKEIKDVIAYLRVICSQYDAVSLKRILNVPTRGIGANTVTKLDEYSVQNQCSLWDALKEVHLLPGLTSRAQTAVKSFVTMINELVAIAATSGVTDLTEALVRHTGYLTVLEEERTLEAESRIENVRELFTITRNFELSSDDTSLREFLSSVSLVSDLDNLDSRMGQVKMMTLHTAKGLEFPVVFLVGMEEGIFPHSRSLTTDKEVEEERRLCYVGITRAQEKLFISHTYRRMLYGMTQSNPPSRFLKEIPPQLFNGFTGHGKPNNQAETSVRPERQKLWTQGPTPPRTAPAASTNSGAFRTGQKVAHATFGVGVVLQSLKEGDDELVSVAFPGHGVKKLLQSMAKLKPV